MHDRQFAVAFLAKRFETFSLVDSCLIDVMVKYYLQVNRDNQLHFWVFHFCFDVYILCKLLCVFGNIP